MIYNKIRRMFISCFNYLKIQLQHLIYNIILVIMDDRYIKFESQKKNADDCAIRAIMKLTNRDWVTCYDELCDIGRKKKRMPNEWKVIEYWLKNNGYVKRSFGKMSKGQHRLTVNEFVKKYNNGHFLLNLRGHVVASINGFYFDSWNCGYCKVLTYYELI